MQIKIHLKSDKNIYLPIHYNNMIQAFIYNNIDEDLAKFLHDQGYICAGRYFKLFTFSRIMNRAVKEGNCLNFFRDIEIMVSSPITSFTRSLMDNILKNKRLNLGSNKLYIHSVEAHPIKNTDRILVDCLSPIVTYRTINREDGSKFTHYYASSDLEFIELIKNNLYRKYRSIHKRPIDDKNFNISLVGKEDKSISYYKGLVIVGVCGRFLIEGNKELIRLALTTGLGSKNSQGFGMIRPEEMDYRKS